MQISDIFRKFSAQVIDHGLMVAMKRAGHYLTAYYRLTQDKDWPRQKEKWENRLLKSSNDTLVIIGNGPSLIQTQMFLLRNHDTIGFNHIDLMKTRNGWMPKYFMITDDLIFDDKKEEILRIVENSDFSFFPFIHPSGRKFFSQLGDLSNVLYLNSLSFGFHRDLPECGINDSVVCSAIQVAAFLGYKKVIFVGMDLNYKKMKVEKINAREWRSSQEDVNHFDRRYFSEGRKFHDPNVHRMQESLQKAQSYFSEISFINSTSGGNLSNFRRKSLSDALGYTKDDVAKIFSESTSIGDLDSLILKMKECDGSVIFYGEGSFVVLEPSLEQLLQWAESNAMIIGPWEGMYYVRKFQS